MKKISLSVVFGWMHCLCITSQNQISFVGNSDVLNSSGKKIIFRKDPPKSLSKHIPLILNQNMAQEKVHSIHPFWSPDGRYILYHAMGGATGVFVFDLEKGEHMKVLDEPGGGLTSWGKSEKELFYWSRGESESKIYSTVFGEPGQPVHKQIIKNNSYKGGWVTSLNRKTDQLAFTSDLKGNADIHLLDLTIGESKELVATGMDEFYPQWTTDGEWITYTIDDNGNLDIVRQRADGSSYLRLTDHSSMDAAPTWFPSGSHLTFQSGRDGDVEVYTIKSDGTELKRLTNVKGFDGEPTVSPDGNQIAFVSGRDETFEIYIINSDGSNATRITFGDGSK